MIGNCRKCAKRTEIKGGLCEDCASDEDAKRMQDLLGVRKKKSAEEIEREIAERKKDKRFWWGSSEKQ